MQQEQRPASGTDPALELLCVDVAGYRCALPLPAVIEIHPAVRLTPLPDAPEIVIGLVNRRGRPVPVLDLRSRLGLPPRPLQVADRLVALQLPEREVALLVDAALDALSIDAGVVDEAVARSSDALLSQSVVVLPDGLLVVLDVDAFLSSTDVAVLDEAMQHALATP